MREKKKKKKKCGEKKRKKDGQEKKEGSVGVPGAVKGAHSSPGPGLERG